MTGQPKSPSQRLVPVSACTSEHHNRILKILKPMMADFKGEISELRAEGASQADIEAMLDEFEEAYASSDDAEGKLVIAVLREASTTASPRSLKPVLLGSPVSLQYAIVAKRLVHKRRVIMLQLSVGGTWSASPRK